MCRHYLPQKDKFTIWTKICGHLTIALTYRMGLPQLPHTCLKCVSLCGIKG